MTIPASVARLTNDELTQVSIDGTGLFDVLMRSVEIHLDQEFDKGRISTDQFAKTYISAMELAMGQAVQYLLGRESAYWNAIQIREAAVLAELQQEMTAAQRGLILEQTEAKRAETLDTRSDGTTAVAGSIGKQKALYDQQIDSYEKDAQYKVAKLFSDAWITQKTLDEGLTAPTSFTNAEVDEVMAAVRLANSLGS